MGHAVQIHDEERELLAGGSRKTKKTNRSNPPRGFVSSLPSPPSLTCNPPPVAPVRPLQRCRAPNVDQWAAIPPWAQTSARSTCPPSCFLFLVEASPLFPHQLFRRFEDRRWSRLEQGMDKYVGAGRSRGLF